MRYASIQRYYIKSRLVRSIGFGDFNGRFWGHWSVSCRGSLDFAGFRAGFRWTLPVSRRVSLDFAGFAPIFVGPCGFRAGFRWTLRVSCRFSLDRAGFAPVFVGPGTVFALGSRKRQSQQPKNTTVAPREIVFAIRIQSPGPKNTTVAYSRDCKMEFGIKKQEHFDLNCSC